MAEFVKSISGQGLNFDIKVFDFSVKLERSVTFYNLIYAQGNDFEPDYSGKSVHAETLEGIYGIENQIKTAFNQLRGRNKLSQRCEQFAPGAFCHYLLPTCGRNSGNQVKLCRADCEMLKNSVCDAEFRNFTENVGRTGIDSMISGIAKRFECDKLPQSIEGDQCSTIGLPPVLNTSHACYESTGLGRKL